MFRVLYLWWFVTDGFLVASSLSEVTTSPIFMQSTNHGPAQRRVLFGMIVATLIGLSASAAVGQENPKSNPPKLQLSGPAPGAAPPLSDPKRPAGESVPAFVGWASRSGINQRDEVRNMIAAARNDSAVATELCREISEAQATDFSRTLVTLSVLGELRNTEGEKCLITFLHRPFPKEGTVANGEIVEQTSLGALQAKAVDGIAYAHTDTGDREVLQAAASHPSRIVRAEAINAYMWNHQDAAAARATLLKVVRPNERSFLDRPRLEPGVSRDEFNRKLAAYAKLHPAPRPVKRAPSKLTLARSVADGTAPTPRPTPAPAPPQAKKGDR